MTAEPIMDEPDETAAELVLGLLDDADRAVALRRVLADRAFAGRVEAWRMRLGPLVELVPEVPASPGLLPRIEATLDRGSSSGALRRWRAAAVTAMAIAAALLLFIAVRPLPAPVVAAAARGPVFVAQIVPDGGAPIPAVYDPASATLRLTPAALGDARHSAQLWLIGADGTPHSLGLLAERRRSRLTLAGAEGARIAAGATLAISIEPRGGSPTGLPTGPVVAKGTLSLV